MIYIITGPSGVGKNTIIEAMSTDLDFYISVSHTTRPQRESEIDGEDYYFITDKEFKSLVDDNLMIEYEQYGGFYYGTSKKEVLKESNIILLDLEVNGATKLLSQNSDYIGIFIDIDDEELISRLKNRGHDDNFIKERKGPKEIFNILKRKEFASDEILKKYIKTFFQLFARNQWKRERTAPSFHFDDYSLDASSWLRFPILSNNFEEEIDNL